MSGFLYKQAKTAVAQASTANLAIIEISGNLYDESGVSVVSVPNLSQSVTTTITSVSSSLSSSLTSVSSSLSSSLTSVSSSLSSSLTSVSSSLSSSLTSVSSSLSSSLTSVSSSLSSSLTSVSSSINSTIAELSSSVASTSVVVSGSSGSLLINSADETTMFTYVIPSNTIVPGATLNFRGKILMPYVTASNSFTGQVKLSGTSVATMVNGGPIDNDSCFWDINFYAIQAAGASKAVGVNGLAIGGVTVSQAALVSSSVFHTNSPINLTVTGQWEIRN